MTERRIEELARKIGNSLTDEVEWEIIEETLIECADEQKAIDIEIAVAWLRKYVRPYYRFSIEDFKKDMAKE